MGIKSAKRRYWEQKDAAYGRDIPFKFTFEEWVNWWERNLGPNWLDLRGHTKGKFVMARFNDCGSYEPGNVKCITCEENHSEGTRGIRNTQAKLTEATVLEIFKAKGSNKTVGKQFGVPASVVGTIKAKNNWKHLTKDLHHPERRSGSVPKLTKKQVLAIFKSKALNAELAQRYGVDWATIYDIKEKELGMVDCPAPSPLG